MIDNRFIRWLRSSPLDRFVQLGVIAILIAIAVPNFRACQRQYGHVPLKQAVLAYLGDHAHRFPPSWDALYPYLEASGKWDAG